MASREKKHPRDYMAWAGFFLDPEADAEVFSTLPGWRQRQILYGRKQSSEGRSPTLDELLQAGRGTIASRIDISLPDSFPARLLHVSDCRPAPGDGTLDRLRPWVFADRVLAECTFAGEGKLLRSDKPVHGLFAFIWAMARARRGVAPSLPLSAFFDLDEGIEQISGELVQVRLPESIELVGWLTEVADDLNLTVA